MSKTRALVIGNCCIDRLLVGRPHPDAEAIRFDVDHATTTLGGAAGVATWLSAAGVDVTLGFAKPPQSAPVFDSAEGLLRLMPCARAAHLPVRSRYVAGNELRLIAEGALEACGSALSAKPVADSYDVVVVSDYGARASGWLTSHLLEELLQGSPRIVVEQLHRSVLAPLPLQLTASRRIVVVNARDALPTFRCGRDLPLLAQRLDEMGRATLDAATLVATAGPDGVFVQLPGQRHLIWLPVANPVDVVDTTGSGDLFVATLTRLLANADAGDHDQLLDAIEYAQDEVSEHLLRERGGVLVAPTSPIGHDATTVVAGGCFDPPHRSHVELLKHAALLGSVVVALNSDASVAALKGPGRPVLPFAHRMAILGAMRYVQQIRQFDDLTPERLLRELGPTIFVKGNDYAHQCPEGPLMRELGGVALVIRGRETNSSSELLARFSEEREARRPS